MVKGIASWEFPKEQSLVEDKPESGTQKYSKCQTPPYEKNKLLLNEYLGDIMYLRAYSFSVEMVLTPPPINLPLLTLNQQQNQNRHIHHRVTWEIQTFYNLLVCCCNCEENSYSKSNFLQILNTLAQIMKT